MEFENDTFSWTEDSIIETEERTTGGQDEIHA